MHCFTCKQVQCVGLWFWWVSYENLGISWANYYLFPNVTDFVHLIWNWKCILGCVQHRYNTSFKSRYNDNLFPRCQFLCKNWGRMRIAWLCFLVAEKMILINKRMIKCRMTCTLINIIWAEELGVFCKRYLHMVWM